MRPKPSNNLSVASVVLVATLATAPITLAAPTPNGGGSPVWSPDGRHVAFASATPNTPVNLWVTGVGGGPRRLTARGARPIGWAPDSQSIYCHTMRDGQAACFRLGIDGQPEQPAFTFLKEGVTAVALSPDGRRLAFVRRTEGKRNLWVADTDGANERQLSDGLSVRTAAWSPDGQLIAFEVGGVFGEATFVVPAAGGAEPQLVFGGVGSYPSWSPDGKRLALLGLHSATVVGADGKESSRLHISQDERGPLSWSPDGKLLVYTSVNQGQREIATVEVSSGKVTVLSPGWAQAALPRWSPDGRSVVFEAARPGAAATDVHVLEVGAKRPRSLTQALVSEWSGLRSGDGQTRFFLSNAAGPGLVDLLRRQGERGRPTPTLRVNPRAPLQLSWPAKAPSGLAVNGDVIWRLSAAAAPQEVLKTEHPTWADLSPSGEELAYVKWQEHRPSLVVRHLAEGTEREVLPAPGPGQAYSKLAWSPRGQEIAFVRGEELCKVRLADSSVAVLASAPEGPAGDTVLLPPMWSRDGRRLVFGRFGRGGGQRLKIWLAYASGEQLTLLSSSPIAAEHGRYADPLAMPYAWAPDGRSLAFCSELDGTPALYAVRIGRDKPAPVLLRRAAAYPDWSTDGQTLGYTDLQGNREALRSLRWDDGAPESLALGPPLGGGGPPR